MADNRERDERSEKPKPYRGARIHDTLSGREVFSLPDCESDLWLEFSPDGRSLAVAGDDGSLSVIEIASGKVRLRFEGHERETRAYWLDDGRHLIGVSDDAPILVWHTHRRKREPAKLSVDELASLWTELASDDAQAAYRAIETLAADPRRSAAYLSKRLVEWGRERRDELTHVSTLIDQLDARQFDDRESATARLARMMPEARTAVREALRKGQSEEAERRLRKVLLGWSGWPPGYVRMVRAVETLERARAVREMRELLKSAEGTLLERELRSALGRMAE